MMLRLLSATIVCTGIGAVLLALGSALCQEGFCGEDPNFNEEWEDHENRQAHSTEYVYETEEDGESNGRAAAALTIYLMIAFAISGLPAAFILRYIVDDYRSHLLHGAYRKHKVENYVPPKPTFAKAFATVVIAGIVGLCFSFVAIAAVSNSGTTFEEAVHMSGPTSVPAMIITFFVNAAIVSMIMQLRSYSAAMAITAKAAVVGLLLVGVICLVGFLVLPFFWLLINVFRLLIDFWFPHFF